MNRNEILDKTEFCDLVDKVIKSGLECEVIVDALLAMKTMPHSSPLLCLQIAAKDWDV